MERLVDNTVYLPRIRRDVRGVDLTEWSLKTRTRRSFLLAAARYEVIGAIGCYAGIRIQAVGSVFMAVIEVRDNLRVRSCLEGWRADPREVLAASTNS